MNTIESFKTVNEVETYRKKINEQCDKHINYLILSEKADDYSTKSFGYIKECFESLSPELFKTSEGKKILKKYTTTIKESKCLSSLHNLHEAIRKGDKNCDADFFVNTISETEWVSKGSKKDIKKLGNILAEGIMYLGKNFETLIPKEDVKLYNAINFIAENKKSTKNINEYSSAIKVIKENISSKEPQRNIKESVNLDKLASEMISEFNKKYADKLTLDEANLVKEISSSANKEELFNKYKENCINKLSEAKAEFKKNGNADSDSRLGAVIEQVANKEYDAEKLTEDICNLSELSKIFD